MTALRPGAARPAVPSHRYTLGDFGLTAAQVNERFAGYLAARG
jgi:hypothetical protein